MERNSRLTQKLTRRRRAAALQKLALRQPGSSWGRKALRCWRLGSRLHCFKLEIDHYFISYIESAVLHGLSPGESEVASVNGSLPRNAKARVALPVLYGSRHGEGNCNR